MITEYLHTTAYNQSINIQWKDLLHLFVDESLHDVHNKADEFWVHGQRLYDCSHEQCRECGEIHQLLHDQSKNLLCVDVLLSKTHVGG